MALRLRRGTNAERLTITPESGELIYVTDNKKLYVGDGSTLGGTVVSGLVDVVDDTSPSLGGDLDLNGNNITGTGNINITGTITATGNINLGDGAGGDIISVGGSVSGALIPDQDLVHDIGSGSLRWRNAWFSSISAAGQITADSIQADLIADDSSVAYNTATNTFSGIFNGVLDGELTGSVFGDDSLVIVDAIDRSIRNINYIESGGGLILENDSLTITPRSGNVNIGGEDENGIYRNATLLINRNNTGGIAISSQQYRSTSSTTTDFQAVKYRGTADSPAAMQSGDKILEIVAKGYDGAGLKSAGDIGITATGAPSGAVIPGKITIQVGNAAGTGAVVFEGTSDGVWTTEGLTVTGNATVNGSVTSSFVGSLASDNSTMVIDNNGSIVNLNFTGNVAGTPGDTGTVDSWLQVVVNGATKYIPLYA